LCCESVCIFQNLFIHCCQKCIAVGKNLVSHSDSSYWAAVKRELERRTPFSGMCRLVVLVWTDVCSLQPPAHPRSSLVDFYTLKMEEICSFETWFTLELHDATSQKTVFFIVTAVKTSNLTQNSNKLVIYIRKTGKE
jgi:hypothetical protein